MNSFNVHSRAAGDVDVLDLSGDLDAHTAPRLEAALEAVRASGRCRVVVVFEKLSYISSAGLGVFMAFIEEMRQRGGDIKLAGMPPKIFNVFDLLGFPLLFDIQPTERDAMSRFAAPEGGAA
jgi:anti-sigma B factor antagonist